MNPIHALFVLVLVALTESSLAEELEAPRFEIIARLDEAPGNITVTVDGRIILSLHQFYAPKYAVVELKRDGTLVPFPNEAVANTQRREESRLESVLGIRSDGQGIVWMLDNGMRYGSVPKLVGWDSRRDRLHKLIELAPPVTPKDQFVNDFAVDMIRNAIYISDPAGGHNAALIVVHIDISHARRLLEGHSSVVPEAVDLVIDGQPLQVKDDKEQLSRPHIGVNPITLDTKNEWVYFGPMHGRSLYRVKAVDLVDSNLTKDQLAERVERYSDKPICDGISIDRSGNIYVGELAANAIGVITPERKYNRLMQDKTLSWVDAFSFGPHGKLYAVVNRLHQTAVLNAGKAVSQPPYFVLEINPLTEGIAGR